MRDWEAARIWEWFLLLILKRPVKFEKNSLVGSDMVPLRMCLWESAPLLGLPVPTLAYISKPDSPLTQVCGEQQSELYSPHTGASLQ